jgi:hypothetical protein
MTREKCKNILPVIEAFANGENIEFYDDSQITGTFSRGEWKTTDDIGFGRPTNYYRMIKNNEIIYFGNKLF